MKKTSRQKKDIELLLERIEYFTPGCMVFTRMDTIETLNGLSMALIAFAVSRKELELKYQPIAIHDENLREYYNNLLNKEEWNHVNLFAGRTPKEFLEEGYSWMHYYNHSEKLKQLVEKQ